MKFQATYRAWIEIERAAGDGWHVSRYLRMGFGEQGRLCACAHFRCLGWGEEASIWRRFIFPITVLYPLGSTMSREHCGVRVGGALLLCDSRCKGLYVHHRFIAFLDQNSFSHSALLSKSSLGTWAFIHLGHWILLSTPSVRGGGELPPLSMRGGNLEK